MDVGVRGNPTSDASSCVYGYAGKPVTIHLPGEGMCVPPRTG